MTVVCATDANHLRAILRASTDHPGAMYIRLGRGRDPQVYPEVPRDFRIGKAATLRKGKDLALIACGSMLRATLDAADLLSKQGSKRGYRHAHDRCRRCCHPRRARWRPHGRGTQRHRRGQAARSWKCWLAKSACHSSATASPTPFSVGPLAALMWPTTS
jgi:hypothetical protein